MTSNKPKDTSVSARELRTILVKEFINDYSYRIDMDADYQREKIWSTEEQERLIDSILKEIDIPKIYLAEVEGNNEFDFECIDGKQRMMSLLYFFRPEDFGVKPLKVTIITVPYTYERLKADHPRYAKQMEDYELHFLIYKKKFLDEREENFINTIFRRLQLGIRLNAGETLKSYTGGLRDFIFKEIGGKGDFLKSTRLSDRRFQKELALAQISFNSIKRNTEDDSDNFARARTSDIETFIIDNPQIQREDANLSRIKSVLRIMDNTFGTAASNISGRAAVVSAYLFVEDLYQNNKQNLIADFAKFYLKLLNDIKENMSLVRGLHEPKNRKIMDRFQKYILQASVESPSIKRRHDFLREAFTYYLDPKTKGKIIGSA